MSMRIHKIVRLCWALLLPLPTFAATPTFDLSERAVQLDQVTQALKDEAVELGREVGLIDSAINTPEHRRLSVYLRVKVAGFLLKEARVTLDDQATQTRQYSETDSRAFLSSNSSQRVLRTAATPGAHRIELNFRGAFADDGANAPPIVNTYRAVFDKAVDDETELEFVISRASRFNNEVRVDLIELRKSQ